MSRIIYCEHSKTRRVDLVFQFLLGRVAWCTGAVRRQPKRSQENSRNEKRGPLSAYAARRALVERFDIEPFPDFSAKWANFTGLVLFCIDAKFCKKIFVGKLLTRYTRFTCFCTAQISIFLIISAKFLETSSHVCSTFLCTGRCVHWTTHCA